MKEIRFGRSACGDLATSGALEWLVTNGIGGYASGTVAGPRSRRYHGLLVAALDPPLGRVVLATGVDESVTREGRTTDLHASRWGDGSVNPRGYEHLEAFWLQGRTPVWRWALGDILLEKRIAMVPGKNTTAVVYRLLRAETPVLLTVKILAGYRDSHATTRSGDWKMDVRPEAPGIVVRAFDGARPLRILGDGLALEPAHAWYQGYLLEEERVRGFADFLDDSLHVATATAELSPGASVALVFSAEDSSPTSGEAVLAEVAAAEEALLVRARSVSRAPLDGFAERLVLAADQFVVNRDAGGEQGKTVIAGYPWFGDWGRDTMISLPGLALVTGRPQIARSVLVTFARFVDEGMLPNRFPDAGEAPEYNTVDATLWYLEAVRSYVEAAEDDALVAELWPVLEEIVRWHERGTRYGIVVDPADGLLRSGTPGVQLTWMDARVGDTVMTPRHGKCVEINALWYNGLVALARLSERLGHDSAPWSDRAARVRTSFQRFWDDALGHCLDVIDGPAGDDPSLRPNQIFAVSLPASPLDPAQQKSVVAACARELLTSHGLRSLSPGHPDYRGLYVGGPDVRDARYHQGTVWSWLLGPFALAHFRVHGDAAAARSFLEPLGDHLSAHGLGSISEIFDGDPPHLARGCIAQAWSVAETLRAWQELQNMEVVR